MTVKYTLYGFYKIRLPHAGRHNKLQGDQESASSAKACFLFCSFRIGDLDVHQNETASFYLPILHLSCNIHVLQLGVEISLTDKYDTDCFYLVNGNYRKEVLCILTGVLTSVCGQIFSL